MPTVYLERASISSVTDDELVERTLKGDSTAFSELVLRHGQVVYRAALAALGSPADAEDIATLLGFLTTDAWVEPTLLQQALQLSVCETFEAVAVDREYSMNDSLFAFASGASGVIVNDDETYLALVEGLFAVSRELAVSR